MPRTPLLDRFFYYVTFLGEGITCVVLIIVLLLWLKLDNRTFLIGMSSFGGISIIVQFIKRIVLPYQLRPSKFISSDISLHFVENVSLHSYLSFPSGHATTIFMTVCFMVLTIPPKHKIYSFLAVLIATIIAYSRVYLSQHFYEDIYVGSLIGVRVTTFVYAFFIDLEKPVWLNKKLVT